MSYIITRISSACKTVRGHLMVLLRRLVDKYGVWYIYIAKEGRRMIGSLHYTCIRPLIPI